MSKENKLEINRIIIFCLLSVLPLAIAAGAVYMVCKVPVFINEEYLAVANALAALGMFAPAIASILTRVITKEGFGNMYLALNFKGNVKYYLASVWVKLIEGVVCLIVIPMVFINGISFAEIFATQDMSARLANYIWIIGLTLVLFMPGLGEELGWRGYLMPKLVKLIGKPGAVVVGGIIWGLWHFPITLLGHNFGVDYPGYPWLGILMMCILCILMNPLLMLLTEKTKSIYPASFCHMMNNNMSYMTMMQLFASEGVIEHMKNVSSFLAFWIYISVVAVTGAISYILLIRNKRECLK